MSRSGSGSVIDLVGPKGYTHGWHFVGIPGTAQAIRLDAAQADSNGYRAAARSLRMAAASAQFGDHKKTMRNLLDAQSKTNDEQLQERIGNHYGQHQRAMRRKATTIVRKPDHSSDFHAAASTPRSL